MFGYVTFNRQELKIKDYELYRSFYCGLCRELRERYGIPGQLTLTYDMTFVILLLSGLYEPPVSKGKTRCVLQPVRPHTIRKNRFTEYAADINVILTYYKCLDDWKDEKKALRLVFSRFLEGNVKKLRWSRYEKLRGITSRLAALSRLEKNGSSNPDEAAGIFGSLMAEIFVWKEDAWAPHLREMGFFLGKFIYLLDAYEDIEKDEKNGNYNPLLDDYKMTGDTAEFETRVKGLLTMVLSEACAAFERLPVIAYGDILRNILYSGVWIRFEAVSRKREKKRENES